jgi:6-phosphogluconolactonase (cycloisomerase 2 family)
LLSVDGTHLFVSNQDSNTITVLNVAAGGSLSFQGSYVTAPSFSADGIAINPAGNRLYVTTGDQTLNVHSVAADGSLTQLQAADLGTPSTAGNGVVYVSLPGGDFVYVNNNEIPNTLTSFPVLSDGTLATGTAVATGGDGFPLGFYASPRLLAGSDRRLYALNEASNSISVFNMDPGTGNLTPVTGSPFILPAGSDSSGALAISANATSLFAATTDGKVIKYAIDPATGNLSVLQTGFTGVADGIAGLLVDPTGALLVGTLFLTQQIAVLSTATMSPAPNSPFIQDGATVSPISWGAGILFNQAGTILFTADANYTRTQASSYVFAK